MRPRRHRHRRSWTRRLRHSFRGVGVLFVVGVVAVVAIVWAVLAALEGR
jgi:hypothetical protein